MRALAERGFEIGVHGTCHDDWTKFDPERLNQELGDSSRTLREITGDEPDSCCYPYGAWNDAVRRQVEAAGFRVACTAEPGRNDFLQDRFLLKRGTIRPGVGILRFFWRLWRS